MIERGLYGVSSFRSKARLIRNRMVRVIDDRGDYIELDISIGRKIK